MTPQLAIVYVAVVDLAPAPRNPKRHAAAAIEASVQRFGFAEPIVRDERTGRIVSGHGRREVLLEMERRGLAAPSGVVLDDRGRWTVPVVSGWRSKDDADAEAFLLAVNRTVEAGGWSEADLGRVLSDLRASIDMTALGFDRAAIARSIKAAQDAANAALAVEPALPERPKDPITKPGDLWKLGPHRVLCGDSTRADDVARLMDGKRARVVFTDPPYAIYGSSSGLSSSVTDDKIVRPFFRDVLAAAQGATDLFAHVYVCCDWRSWPSWWEASKLTRLAPKNLIVWDKGGAGLGNNWANTYELVGFLVNMPEQRTMESKRVTGMRPVLRSNVVRFDRVRGPEREHNAAKPVGLCRLFLEAGSDAGDLALDLFSGSGSTLIGAEQAGRVCNLMEIDPAWVDVTVARFERSPCRSWAGVATRPTRRPCRPTSKRSCRPRPGLARSGSTARTASLCAAAWTSSTPLAGSRSK